MSERAATIDDATMKFGLLMESAEAHQRMAEAHLEKLRSHTQDLDGVVREEIRRTLIEELQELTLESRRAAQALHGMRRAANLRALLWSVLLAVLSTAIPGAIVYCTLPSAGEIDGLRKERSELAANVARLRQQGGRVDLRHCGEPARLCVRVDRRAPTYGEGGDYFIVEGY